MLIYVESTPGTACGDKSAPKPLITTAVMSAEGYTWHAINAAHRNPNVMEVGLIPGARRKRPCASFGTSIKHMTTRHAPGSPLALFSDAYITPPSYSNTYMTNRYVQQQGLLIGGLPNLYRLATTGNRWPGDQVMLKLNGQPFVDGMLSRLSPLSQGPAIPSPFLPSSPLYNGSSEKTSISGCKSTLEPFMGRIWGPHGLPDVSQIVEGFINPLPLQRIDDGNEDVFTQIDEHKMMTDNKSRFSGDPDILLLELSTYIFTNYLPSSIDLSSEHEVLI